jgi:hypothetical protein
MSRRFHVRALIALAAASLFASIGVPPANAAGAPTLKLVAARAEVTISRRGHFPVPLTVGVFTTAINGPFEIHANRADYDSPIVLTRWRDGHQIATLPDGTADGWNGMANFFDIKVKNDLGVMRLDTTQTFCPSTYSVQRVNDSGPQIPTFPPYGCGTNPFTLGSVAGIDEGWGVNAFDPYGGYYYGYNGAPMTYFQGKDGHYTVNVAIDPQYRDLLWVSTSDGTIQVGVTIVTKKRCRYPCYGRNGQIGASTPTATSSSPGTPLTDVPTVNAPDPSTEPDLIPLPAWGISVSNHRNGNSYLNFGATVWNDGPAPMVVEGFRRPNTDIMDAYQYFYDRQGNVVGRASAGTMEYDSRPGHRHWHFEQFANYALLDGSGQNPIYSTKEAFCLAPTDPIDLTAIGADWMPSSIGLGTACGDHSAIWVRETLDAGWGDTYVQYLPGQSFNITDLPNGKYFIQVAANPSGVISERSTANDVTTRRVVLKGKPGHRRVGVPLWHGIDSEGCYYYCGGFGAPAKG